MKLCFTLFVFVLGVVLFGCDGRKEFSLRHELKPQSTEELLALSEADLERVDVGRMNLICARETGCGTAFELADLVRELDVWAEKARQYEMRYRKTFERNPSRYDNSYAKYKALRYRPRCVNLRRLSERRVHHSCRTFSQAMMDEAKRRNHNNDRRCKCDNKCN